MLLKDYITLLQSKYDEFANDPEWMETCGEPLVYFDKFEQDVTDHTFCNYHYAGAEETTPIYFDPELFAFIVSAFKK